jgi:vitamin B12 transporter
VRAGAAWRFAPTARLRASVGNAFKAPSFFENFATGFTIGNTALRPERTRSAELGVEAMVGQGTLLRLTGFSQRFRDLIQYTSAPPSPGDPNYYNIAEADAGGVEFEATVPDVAGFRLGGSYTWTDTRVVDAGFDTGSGANFVAGGRLIRRPEHAASLQLSRSVDGVGTFSAIATRTGAREDRDFSAYPATAVMLRAFTTVDLSAEPQLPAGLLPAARLQLRAENVADVRYEQIVGFAAPGRTLYAGLRLQR